jgi:hypothetical protein
MAVLKEGLRSQDVSDKISRWNNDIENGKHQKKSNMFGDGMLRNLLETFLAIT